jgi:hypothetical protein
MELPCLFLCSLSYVHTTAGKQLCNTRNIEVGFFTYHFVTMNTQLCGWEHSPEEDEEQEKEKKTQR